MTIRVFGPMDKHATEQVLQNAVLLYYKEMPQADPFILLSEDWFSRVGFDWHPHRGFETVTYVIEGELEHIDNAGGSGVLKAGDLQWVTTGRGVLHAELAYNRKPVHTLQLWMNLPKRLKMVEPRYQDISSANAAVTEGRGAVARVYSGTVHGVRGPAQNYWPATVIDVRFQAGGIFLHDAPEDQTLGIYVISGDLPIHGTRVRAGQMAWRYANEGRGSETELQAHAQSHVIAYSARPIGESFVQYGPFVMNTEAEIQQAFADLRAGKFGTIPSAV